MGFYKHFKGGYYFKLLSARDCDTLKEYAVYVALQKNGSFEAGQGWLRLLTQFNDTHPTVEVKRMHKLGFVESVLFITGLKKYIK